jgi:hypothetical protein
MLFADLLPERDYRGTASAERKELLECIVAGFRKAFPAVSYELRLEFRLINAQAVAFGDERCVIVYGGLGFHPRLSSDGLTFVLLHETGHHLAKGRRLPYYRSLACECESDRWAIAEGRDQLFAKTGSCFQARRALEELNAVLSVGQDLPSPEVKMNSGICWNRCWPLRQRSILDRAATPEEVVKCDC